MELDPANFEWHEGDPDPTDPTKRLNWTARTRTPFESTRAKQRYVVEKRKEGYQWNDIGEMIRPEKPLSPQHVRELYKGALAAIIAPEVEELRVLEMARLDSMLVDLYKSYRKFFPLVNSGQVIRDSVDDANGNPMFDENGKMITVRLEDIGPRMAIISQMLKIQDRRAKLMGLDKPVRKELTGADGAPLNLGGLNLAGLSDTDLATVVEILSRNADNASQAAPTGS